MHSLNIDTDPEVGRFDIQKVEVFPDECGTLLKFQLDAEKYEIPEFAEVWVGVRDAAGKFVTGNEPFVDDDGDFLVSAPIEGGAWAVYLPTGAMRHPDGGVYTVYCLVVSDDPEDEDYGLVLGTVSHEVMIPGPCEWDIIEWIRPVVDLCGQLAAVAGLDDAGYDELAAHFVDWFDYDGIMDPSALAAALKAPINTDLGDAAMSIPLRVPELVPENVIVTLVALFDVALDGPVGKESAFVKKVAETYGISGKSWKELVKSLQDEMNVAE